MKVDDDPDIIRTTFIKSYANTLFRPTPFLQMCYDRSRNQFMIMELFVMPKTSYNFIRQKVHYLDDNFRLAKIL